MSLKWRLEKRTLPLRFVWKIARGTLVKKESYFVSTCDSEQSFLGYGEVAPNTRYHNTPEVIERDFQTFLDSALIAPQIAEFTLQEFGAWLDRLSLCNTLRFGIESAWVHFQSNKENKTVGEFLGVPRAPQIQTSFSVPIMEPAELEAFLRPLARFHALKIKVDAETAVEALDRITRLTSQKLRIDGNEAFDDPAALMHFVEGLRGKNIEFLEQPMPASMKDAYREILPRLPFPLIGDESIEDHADFADLAAQFSGVNIKLMKTGGYVRAIELLKGARAHGLKTMLGCMVETSLGISSAMHLASLIDYADL
ncbi:MAG TPA: hypothetical protein DCS07_02810, partial [Bdellovibrionales bacterium]|nr:hypothetical protein [Bdellovibrionales bacterium]